MYHIVEKRNIWFYHFGRLDDSGHHLHGLVRHYYAIQLLPLSIDYTGGSVWEVSFDQAVQPTAMRQVFVDAGYGGDRLHGQRQ